MFFINFKNYSQAFEGFPRIYKELEEAAKRYPKVQTIFAPPPLLFAKVAETVKIPLWAQHLDPMPLGPYNGFLPAKATQKVGASGTFLNHSEHPLKDQALAETVAIAREIGLSVLIFAATPEVISKVRKFDPDYIAYEPPELIGAGVTRGVSVATAKTEIIPEAVEAARPIPLLIGAGIFKREDIEIALRQGAVGGAASSAIVTAPQPAAVLDELLSAYPS